MFNVYLSGEIHTNWRDEIKTLSHKEKLNISFSVKKKIAIAVKRNKIKRRLRQIFNDGIKQNLIKLEKSVLVIAHTAMLNNEYKIIKETLFKDFEKIK